MTEARAPLQGCDGRHRDGFPIGAHAPLPATTIPMRVAQKVYREVYHYSQSLERLNERGGFGCCEIPFYYIECEKRNDVRDRR